MPKIIINDIYFKKTSISILAISNHNSFRVLFDKIASVYFIWKIYLYLYFSIGNGRHRDQHCANCIGTLSFPKRLRTGIARSILEYFRYSAKYSRVAATEWLIPHVIIPTLRTSLVERSKLNHVGGRLLADDNVWSARNWMARTDDDAAVNLFDVLPTDDKMQSAIDHNSPRKPPRRCALSVAERLHADLSVSSRDTRGVTCDTFYVRNSALKHGGSVGSIDSPLSPSHSFIPGSKPSFSANPSHRSLSFILHDWPHGFPGLFTDTSEHIRFYFFCFRLLSGWFRAVD